MDIHILLAEAFRYPEPGLLEQLETGLTEASSHPAKKGLAAFVRHIGQVSLSDWEELYTRTLDLSPAVAPYIGLQVWGESYQRGEFMAKLNRAMADLDINPEGELPDHIVPVLRYLSAARRPLPELLEQFEPSLRRMASVLREKDKANPYLHLFDAALGLAAQLKKEEKA